MTIAWAKRRAAQEMRNNGLSGKNCGCINTLFRKCGRQDCNAQLQAKANNVIDDGDIEMKDNAMLKYVTDSTKKKLGKKGRKGRKGRGRNSKEDKKLLVAGEENSDWLTHSDPKTGKDYFSNKNTGRVTWSDHSKNKLEEQNETKLSVGLVDGGNNEIETKKNSPGTLKYQQMQKNNNTHSALTKPTEKNKFSHSKRKKPLLSSARKPTAGSKSIGKSVTFATNLTNSTESTASTATILGDESIKMRSSSKLQSTSDLRGETWEKHLDPASGKVFFYNKEKGVTQWNEPPGFSKYDTSQKALTHTDSIKMRSTSKLQSTSETWEKHLDPASGRVFFYNKEKGVTQWNEPPGFSN